MKKFFRNNPLAKPALLFFISFSLGFGVLLYENVYRIDEWKKINLETLGYKDIRSITEWKNAEKKEPTIPDEYLKQSVNMKCYQRFMSDDDHITEFIVTGKDALGVLVGGGPDNECFKNSSKIILSTAEIIAMFALIFSVFVLINQFLKKIKFHLFQQKYKHTLIVGLTAESRYLAESIWENDPNQKIVFIENDKEHSMIDEIEQLGAIVIIGDPTQEHFLEDARVYDAKEVFLMGDDFTNLEVVSIIDEKMKDLDKNLRYPPLKVYIHLEESGNRELFDTNGLYNLLYDNREYYPFSKYASAVDEVFESQLLIKTIENPWDPNDVQRYLIVGFNKLAQELIYELLKRAHFVNKKAIEVVVASSQYEELQAKYANWIEIGENPYGVAKENPNKQPMWHLRFVSDLEIYNNKDLFLDKDEKFIYNRIVFCGFSPTRVLGQHASVSKYYYQKMVEKKTIVQLYNPSPTFGKAINDNNDDYNYFYTFGSLAEHSNYKAITSSELLEAARKSNNYKEIIVDNNLGKAWETLDLFTRESNLAEKDHMRIKLHALGLDIEKKCIISKQPKTQKKDEEIINDIDQSKLEEEDKEKLKKIAKDFKKKKQSFFGEMKSISDNKNNDDTKEVLKELYKNYFYTDEILLKTDKENIQQKASSLNSNLLPHFGELLDLADLSDDDFGMLDSFYTIWKLADIEKEKYDQIAEVEHTRWNAYHLLHGFNRKKSKGKDLKAKLHFNLCDWETLKKEDPGVLKYDYKNIYQISYIMKQLGYEVVKNKHKYVGITGHRDIEAIHTEKLKEQIRETFRDESSESTITILTPLADGADRIVAEVALEEEFKEIQIQVPIPMDIDTYKKTFAKGLSPWKKANDKKKTELEEKSIKEFDALLKMIDERNKDVASIIDIGFDKDRYERASKEDQRTIRHEQYTKVGEYIASRSHVLIGMVDEKAEGKEGGTKEIITKKRSGKYKFYPSCIQHSVLYIIETPQGESKTSEYAVQKEEIKLDKGE